MQFVRTFRTKNLTSNEFGCVIIHNGTAVVRIKDRSVKIEQIGIIEGGIGCVLSKRKTLTKATATVSSYILQDGDLPIHLSGKDYKFRIPAKKLNDNELVFMFEDATMMNSK